MIFKLIYTIFFEISLGYFYLKFLMKKNYSILIVDD